MTWCGLWSGVDHDLVWTMTWCGLWRGVDHDVVWIMTWCGLWCGVDHDVMWTINWCGPWRSKWTSVENFIKNSQCSNCSKKKRKKRKCCYESERKMQFDATGPSLQHHVKAHCSRLHAWQLDWRLPLPLHTPASHSSFCPPAPPPRIKPALHIHNTCALNPRVRFRSTCGLNLWDQIRNTN